MLKKKDKAIAALLVVLIVALFFAGQYKSNREEFTKERWEAYVGNSRQMILDSFIDRTNVGGLTHAGVEELLGAADETAEEYMIYFLGMPRGLFGTKIEGEDEFLYFHFEDGEVVQLEKVTQAGLPKESGYRVVMEEAPPEDGKFYPSGGKEKGGASQ